MYEEYFGVAERPFEITPDPRYLVLTGSHAEALSTLEYGIASGKGVTLLLGEAGTGKTTLLRKALNVRPRPGDGEALPDGWVYLNNPTLTRREFFELLTGRFGLSALAAASKAQFLHEFEALLAARCARGQTSVLAVDEAQSLPHALLEELRLLANIESDSRKLLPLILAGQPELADRLNDPRLRQLKQRIALRCRLAPLTLRETAAYIATRIRVARGEAARLFTRDAVIAIHQASRGIPRTISVICDNALLAAFASDEQPVGAATVAEVCADFDLDGEHGPTPVRGSQPIVVERGVGADWRQG